MEVVLRPVEVGGHAGNGIPVVLNAVSLAHLDAGNLSNGVPLIGGLEWARQERVFRDRLRCELGVDARGAEEEELLDAEAVGGVDDVGLDLEVEGDEVGRISVVGVNATDFCGGEDYELGGFGGKEGLDVGLAGEIKFGMGAEEEVGEA